MAHAATVSALADNLVQSVLAIDKNDPIIGSTRSVVARGLKDSSYGRTNQFEVKSRLDGLVEKFAVLNRDDLSDALQERLEELPTASKWLPEILALFLSLSDRPVEKTATDALATLRAAEHPDEQLTWEEIIADDPLDETSIWDDVERGYHSSGDETGFAEDEDADSEPTTSTEASTVNEESTEVLAGLLVTQPEPEVLELSKQSRLLSQLSSDDGVLRVSELAVVRESLWMLRGLPTNFYHLDIVTGTIQTRSDVTMMTASRRVVSDALLRFATLGNSVQQVRQWVRSVQPRPYVCTCQAIAEQLLADFGVRLATLEERYVGNSADAVVSVIEVLSETQRFARHLGQIAAIVKQFRPDSPFALLDELFDCVCTAQLTGDDEAFDVLGSLLFGGVQTYLRPVTTWISSGYIAESLQDFFVEQSATTCEPGDLWRSKYTLRRSSDGAPSAPRFMRSIAADMFAMGKAKMFLDQLVQNSTAPENLKATEQGPDLSYLRQEVESNPLMPFSELFDSTLQVWIQSISTDVAPKLKSLLLEQHGLLDLLAAIDSIYFSANGALFQDFADSLFERIQRTPANWSNSFVLTELARETIGGDRIVEPESLFIETDELLKASSITQALQAISTTYHIPWPLQNITREATPHTHAKALTFLLQVSHAYHSLQSRTFELRPLHSTALDPSLSVALHLRQTLIVLTTTLRSHMATVAHALRTQVRTAMLEANDIDAMIAAYAAYKHRLEMALLLSANFKPIREAMISCLVICEKFGPLWDAVATAEPNESSQKDGQLLRGLEKELNSALGFITAGVRNVSRVGGETLLEALAQKLEWMTVH